MLAKDPNYTDDDPPQPVLKYPTLVQPKLDGIRATVVNGKLLSRTLKPIPNREVRLALESVLYEGLDGELLVGDPTAEDAYRRTSSFVMSESKRGEPWAFYVFDKWDEPDRHFGERYESAVSCVQGGFPQHSLPPRRVAIVPTIPVSNSAELERVEAELVGQGYEGLIARDPNSLYKFGRSGKKGPLNKVKRFVDFEAEVVGVYEEMHNANEAKRNALGRTERSTAKAGKVGKGTLGGLILRALNGPCEGIEFRCGTGFDAEQRRALWMASESGTSLAAFTDVAKVKSFPVGVKEKPRHPVFLGWRAAEDMS
jgi:DNA ligase-1